MADTLLKAVTNAESLRLYDSREYVLDSDYTGIDYEVVGTTTLANVTTNPQNILGNAKKYDYNKRFKLEYTPNPSVFRIWRVGSTLETEAPDPDKYDYGFSDIFYKDRSKLIVDSTIVNKLRNIQSYDFTFTGNKNLLEVLSQIGRVFDGIPRLRYDSDDNRYVISFDLLEDLEDNPQFGDNEANIVVSKESNTDNYSTGLVSLIENAMLDGQGNKQTAVVVYPAKNAWTRPRSIDPVTALLKLDNMGIVIEDPNHNIYQVDKIFVRNFNYTYNTSHPTGLDISQYIEEKTLYDAAPDTLDGKGSLLYYQRGTNIIDGLSTIDENESVWYDSTDYRIENILDKLGQSHPTTSYPVLEYEYQIHYVPVIKSNKFTYEEANITTEDKSVYSVYSQDERNISLTQLGLNADRIMARSGINSLNKVYVIDDVEKIPYIGEKINYNGYKYFADVITSTIDNNIVGINMTYSRDFNKIDRFVGYGRDFREYEIVKEDIVWKRINLNNYIVLDDHIYTDNAIDINMFNTIKTSVLNFFTDYPSSVQRLDTAAFRFYNLNGRKLTYITNPKESLLRSDTNDVIMPVIGTTSANSIILTTSFIDNFSAGKYIVKDTDQENVYIQKRARYSDTYGNSPVAYMIYQDSFNINEYIFPKFTSFNSAMTMSDGEEFIYLDKDNKEAIQISSLFHFQSRNKNIEVRPGLVKYNQMVNKLVYGSDDNAIDPGRLALVGITDLAAIKNTQVLEGFSTIGPSPSAIASTSTRSITIVGGPVYGATGVKYEGVAYVFQNTGDIALVVKKEFIGGPPTLLDTIYLNFKTTL
jgi:hypothetical protein